MIFQVMQLCIFVIQKQRKPKECQIILKQHLTSVAFLLYVLILTRREIIKIHDRVQLTHSKSIIYEDNL